MVRFALMLICSLCLFIFSLRAQDAPPQGLMAAPRPLKVWIPAPLIADESSEVFQLLREHTQVFSSRNNLAVEYRIKDVGTIGGIMSTIRSGSEVAPGALPDITLIRRRDLTPAHARQYLQSMETLFSSSLINELGSALEFGQIPLEDGVALYGLPYFFEVLHTVHTRPLSNADKRLSFEDVLANQASLLFPAGRTNGLNQTFYLQYLAAGGLAPDNGDMSIDEAALRSILGFYEQLVDQDLITPDVLTYQSTAAYQTDFINHADQLLLAVFSSSEYLSMLEQQDPNLLAAGIPTANGASISTRDGWLWVIVTPDLTRRTLSARYLEWLMQPDFHARFAMALYQLPSQQAILGDSLPDGVDDRFIAELLDNAILPIPESEGGTAPRLMQEALMQVLHGDTAATAARQALDQFAER